MTKARFLRCSILGPALALMLAEAAPAANLVKNPAFNGGVSPWVPSNSAVLSFDSRDEAGSTSSGSAKLTDLAGQSVESVFQQCLTIDPSVHYRFRADLLFPTGQVAATATAYLYGYSSSNCSGTSLTTSGIILAEGVPPRDDWQTIRNENAFGDDSRFHSVFLYIGVHRDAPDSGAIVANFDNVVFEPGEGTGPCVPDNQDLCLSDFRYRVHVQWETASGNGTARSVQLTPDAGVFTFFDPDNIEVQLKVLNTCSFSHRFWVFGSGTTNVGVFITVTDTKTGIVKAYSNPLGHPFTPILDTDAFATCP